MKKIALTSILATIAISSQAQKITPFKDPDFKIVQHLVVNEDDKIITTTNKMDFDDLITNLK